MNIDPNTFNASMLPNVFFTKILLESSSPGHGHRHPVPTKSGGTGPAKRKVFSANQDKSLKVTLSLTIMDHIDENGFTSWFYNEDLTKYLKIKIIQSQSTRITTQLTKSNFTVLNQVKNQKLFEEQEITVKKDFDQYLTDFISIDTQQNKRFFSVDYTVEFIIDNHEPNNLAYFACCYFDLGALAKDYEMEFLLPDSNANLVRGNVVGEKVIVKSGLQLETYAFVLANGQTWTGAVHRMTSTTEGYLDRDKTQLAAGKNLGWMTGAEHTEESKYLTRTKMANSKIQDFREIDAIKLMNFNLAPASNIFSTIEKGNQGNQRVIQNPPQVYFSPLFLTYAVNGDAQFLFQLDYNRIIRDKTQFGNIIDKASNPGALAEIYKNSRITLLKVHRRRVKSGVVKNRLGSPVFGKPIVNPREPVKLITISSDTPDAILKPVKSRYGGIKEVSLKGSQKQLRTFTVTDKLSSELTDGFYQYGVEVEIRDGTVDFLNKQLKRLISMRDRMKLYYSTASMPKVFNCASGRFTRKLKIYYTNYPDEKLPWIESVAIFIEILTSLTKINNPKSLGKRLFSFINPESGSLEGINAFIELIEMLETKLEYILGPRIHVQTLGNEKKRNVTSQFKTSTITLKRFFNKIWDACERGDLGLDYLAIPRASRDSIGIKGVTTKDFKVRVQQENSIYWTTPNLDSLGQSFSVSALEGLDSETLALTDLTDVENCYFTPGAIYAGNGLIIDRLDSGQETYNEGKYSAATNTYIAHSTGQYNAPGGGSTNQYSDNSAKMPEGGHTALNAILSQLNISIVTPPPTQLDLLTVMQFDPQMLTVGEVLGGADLLSKEGVDDLSPPSCEDKIDKTNDNDHGRQCEPIGSVFVQNLALTGLMSNHFAQTQTPKTPFIVPTKMNLTNFDLNTTDNAIDKLINETRPAPETPGPNKANAGLPYNPQNSSGTDPSSAAASKSKNKSSPNSSKGNVFTQVPNQIRSLILDKTDAVKNHWSDMDVDLMNSPETSELYRYNYDMIAKVEVFRGYEKTKQPGSHATNQFGQPLRALGTPINLMRAPIFSLMTAKDLRRLKGKDVLLCRVSRYTNCTLNIGISNGIHVKYFDEYFLIAKSRASFESRSVNLSAARAPDELDLSPLSVGHGVLGVLLGEYSQIKTTPPTFQSSIQINQKIKTKLEIL